MSRNNEVVVTSRRTAVVEGPLAFQMRRLAAAQAGECGLQIMNLLQVATRLAGGFIYPVAPEFLEHAIQGLCDRRTLSAVILSYGSRFVKRCVNLSRCESAVASNATPML